MFLRLMKAMNALFLLKGAAKEGVRSFQDDIGVVDAGARPVGVLVAGGYFECLAIVYCIFFEFCFLLIEYCLFIVD